MSNVIYVEFSSKLVSTMVWCVCIFVTIMAVPGFSRFIDYNINSFGAPPITYHYPTDQSFQLRDISSSYTPPFPQVTHVYTPPENTYRGFTYQTLDIYGGVSQVGFMTGSEANSLLQDSFKALGTVEIPNLTINKTPNVKINVRQNEENKQISEVKTESIESQQNFRTPLKKENPLPPTGYYFPPIQVNHFQAGASFIAPPLLNGQSEFLRQFGFSSMTDKPETGKLMEQDSARDNTLPSDDKITSSNENNLPETKNDSPESSEQLRLIENLDSESSTLSSNEDQTVANESPTATTERNIGLSSSTDISNEESFTSLSGINSTTKDEESGLTDKPELRNSEENSDSINDEGISSSTSEAATTLTDKSVEGTTIESSTDNKQVA